MIPFFGKIQTERCLTGILVMATLLRLPGIFWGELHKNHLVYFEPDELQHTELSIRFLGQLDPSLFPGFETRRLNTLGFSTQMALLGYPIVKAGGESAKTLLLTGRSLSLLYGVLTVLLVYYMTRRFFKNENAALFAAGAMALFDLGTTYSHYAVPETAYVFWAYLAVYQGILFFEKWELSAGPFLLQCSRSWKHWLWMSLSMGMTLGMKLDFLPLLLLAAALLGLSFTKKISLANATIVAMASFLAVFFFFKMSTGFQSGWSGFVRLVNWLAAENNDLIAKDNHYLYNPLLYFCGTVVGIGLPASICTVVGLKHKSLPAAKVFSMSTAKVLAVFVLMEFLVLWKLDAPFVRRCTIFLPFVAMLAGLGCGSLADWKKNTGRILLLLVAIYTLALTAVSQWNFVNDNRFVARDYLLGAPYAGKPLYADSYAQVPGMPKPVALTEAEVVVMHETKFSRYWKSFTTPFKVPQCCEEVYHCDEQECRFYQQLLRGTAGFRLDRRFQPVDWAPERLLYKHWFGTYETFLGDVLIFEKNEP